MTDDIKLEPYELNDQCNTCGNVSKVRGNLQKKKSIFKDIIQTGGWVVKAFSKNFKEHIFDIRWGQIPF